jgi:hypothetical protein
MSDAIRLSSVTVNCPDARALAGIYADITGGEATFSHPSWATVMTPGWRIAPDRGRLLAALMAGPSETSPPDLKFLSTAQLPSCSAPVRPSHRSDRRRQPAPPLTRPPACGSGSESWIHS